MEESILNKVEKCLALSKSDNPHEAAIALKQAHALMEKHQLTMVDVSLSKISSSSTKGNMAKTPMDYEILLAQLVSKVFDCHVLTSTVKKTRLNNKGYYHNNQYDQHTTIWEFIGVKPANSLAAYAFEVLFRQLKNARKEYIQTELKRCTKTTKTRRANGFCTAWVHEIESTVRSFAKTDNKNDELIQTWIDKTYGDLTEQKGRSVEALNHADAIAGIESARDAVLHDAINTGRHNPLLN